MALTVRAFAEQKHAVLFRAVCAVLSISQQNLRLCKIDFVAQSYTM